MDKILCVILENQIAIMHALSNQFNCTTALGGIQEQKLTDRCKEVRKFLSRNLNIRDCFSCKHHETLTDKHGLIGWTCVCGESKNLLKMLDGNDTCEHFEEE